MMILNLLLCIIKPLMCVKDMQKSVWSLFDPQTSSYKLQLHRKKIKPKLAADQYYC